MNITQGRSASLNPLVSAAKAKTLMASGITVPAVAANLSYVQFFPPVAGSYTDLFTYIRLVPSATLGFIITIQGNSLGGVNFPVRQSSDPCASANTISQYGANTVGWGPTMMNIPNVPTSGIILDQCAFMVGPGYYLTIYGQANNIGFDVSVQFIESLYF